MKEIINSPTPIRTFELKVFVTGYLEGELKDWPPMIQDRIYEALERLAHKVQLPLAIIGSKCDVSYDDEGKESTPFIYVLASEIVARDMRFTSEEAMMKAFKELTHTSALNGGKYH